MIKYLNQKVHLVYFKWSLSEWHQLWNISKHWFQSAVLHNSRWAREI